MHLEVVSFAATAPGAAGAAAAAVSGDSLTMRNSILGKRVSLLEVSADVQTAGFVQLTWPTAHDVTRNIRMATVAAQSGPLIPFIAPPNLQPQENVSATIAGSAVAGDIENGSLHLWYEDCPGLMANLITPEILRQRFLKQVTIFATITAGAGGGYTGSEAITAESDLLLPNQDYAVLGAIVQVNCSLVTLRGPDLANVRVGVPGNQLNNSFNVDWFVRLSEKFGLPCIPVINSGNKNSTFFECVQDENAAAVPVSWNLALLTPGNASGYAAPGA